MLARSAQGLYWMGRYLERADHLCRLLRLQTEALVDRPVAEIYSGWNRIYSSLDRQPPGTGLDMLPNAGFDQAQAQGEGVLQVMGVPGTRAWQISGGDEYTLADSFTLADDLTFESSNPGSVWSCFAQGRENARQIRHCISAEMWRSLNLAYLRIQHINILEIWNSSPEAFYLEIDADIDNFMGVAAATMYRDEGWHFMQLGRFIERAQLSVALYLAQIELFPVDYSGPYEGSESDWVTLLRMYHAVEAYNRAYSVEVSPVQVLELLVTDPLLPDSLCRSLEVVASELSSIAPGPDAEADAAARRLAGRLTAVVNYDWPDASDKQRLLLRLRERCFELHGLVSTAFFDYALTG